MHKNMNIQYINITSIGKNVAKKSTSWTIDEVTNERTKFANTKQIIYFC